MHRRDDSPLLFGRLARFGDAATAWARERGFVRAIGKHASWVSAMEVGVCDRVCRMEVAEDDVSLFARCPDGRCSPIDLEPRQVQQAAPGFAAFSKAVAAVNHLELSTATLPPGYVALGSRDVGDKHTLFVWARTGNDRPADIPASLLGVASAAGFGAVVVLMPGPTAAESASAGAPSLHTFSPLELLAPDLKFDRSRLLVSIGGDVVQAQSTHDHPEIRVDFTLDDAGHLVGQWNGALMGGAHTPLRTELYVFHILRLAAERAAAHAERSGLGWLERNALHLGRAGVFGQKGKSLDGLRTFVGEEDEDRAISAGNPESAIPDKWLIRTEPKVRGANSRLRLAVRPDNVTIQIDPSGLRLRGAYSAKQREALMEMGRTACARISPLAGRR